jgi:hypothetical protein
VPGDLAQAARQSACEMVASGPHPDQGKIFNASIAFQDFVGDAGKGAADPVRIHDDRHDHLFAVSLGRG